MLRPGGRFLCLEFSHVTSPALAKLYEQYSFNVIPRIGGLVADDESSYRCAELSTSVCWPTSRRANQRLRQALAGVQRASSLMRGARMFASPSTMTVQVTENAFPPLATPKGTLSRAYKSFTPRTSLHS